MSTPAVLLAGASGFLGRHLLAALVTAGPLRVLLHRRPLSPGPANGVEVAHGDLAEPGSLAGCCAGIQTLVHAACYIGGDPDLCDRVNARGTEALVAEARRAGVRRFLYMSSAAIYGYAVHRGADEATAVVAPATPISRSRVRAERAVLEVGGTVIRPLFVYGEGDTRFVPAIAGAVTRLPFLIDRGRARLSVIRAQDLARGVAALVCHEERCAEPAVLHATDGRPVSFRAIVDLLAGNLGYQVPTLSLPYPVARWLVRLSRRDGEWSPSDAHRLFLVSRDHFYDSSRFWRAAGLPQPLPMVRQFEDCLAWYRQVLGAEPAAA